MYLRQNPIHLIIVLSVALSLSCGIPGSCDLPADYGSLIWQDPPADVEMTLAEALEYCGNLSLDGHDDWRLPSISELRSLILACPVTETGGACGVTDCCLSGWDCWTGECTAMECYTVEGPGIDGCHWKPDLHGVCKWYWSSSIDNDHNPEYDEPDAVDSVWAVNFSAGIVNGSPIDWGKSHVRCVRP